MTLSVRQTTMLWVIRIWLILGAVLTIKPAARILSVVFIANLSNPGFLATLGVGAYFFSGFVALMVSGHDRLFGNAWLVALAAAGLCAIGAAQFGLDCSQVRSADLSHLAYYCGDASMTWAVLGNCIAFLLIVVLRKTE